MLVCVIRSGKQSLDAVMPEIGQMVDGSVMLMEREEVERLDYYYTIGKSRNLQRHPAKPTAMRRISGS